MSEYKPVEKDGRAAKDLSGQVFAHLTVLCRKGTRNEQALWRCLCKCGEKVLVVTGNLNTGRQISCGCIGSGFYKRYRRTKEKDMLMDAKKRAKKRGTPFDLVLSDIKIPEFCPVTGAKLVGDGDGKRRNDSASLDEKIPGLGYTKDNVWVISVRANSFKSNFTVDELQRFVANIAANCGAKK